VASKTAKPKRVGLDRLIINALFFRNYRDGLTEMEFLRDDYDWALEKVKDDEPRRFAAAEAIADELDEDDGAAADTGMVGITKHKNIGAVIYDYRFRRPLPPEVRGTEKPAENLYWRIKLAGKGRYKFVLGPSPILVPDEEARQVDVYEATPEIIAQYAFDDEQALLAKVRYNRLIDTFLGITAHSLQNHLRTSVDDVGQIEVDELYVGHDGEGIQYVVPVQAKGRSDKLSIVQTEQDLAFCAGNDKFKDCKVRCVSAQFLPDGRIHLFELAANGSDVEVIQQKRYRLISSEQGTRFTGTGSTPAPPPKRRRSKKTSGA
jgi:hypothetical protein